MVEREDKTLEVDARIDRIAERSMELLGGEAQQTVLQILARRPAVGNGGQDEKMGTDS